MSQVHRVILLNKPLKIRGYTVTQWLVLGSSVGLAFFVGLNMIPKEWKVGNLPVSFLVGLVVFSVGPAFIFMTQHKPFCWWRNNLLYRLGLVPQEYLPHPEPGHLFPDPSNVDASSVDNDYYVR